jgi:ubiquinone/menaquinone biosynthesis C-methylase UbiE
MMQPGGDAFSSATSYEAYVGRWSRFVAQQFIGWLKIAPEQAWLDVGAGTGVLTQVILEDATPSRVIGVDLSADYIAFARQRIHDARVEFRVEDAAHIAVDSPEFDVSVAGLVLNFVPSAEQVVTTMMQAVRDGGMVAAYVWDYGSRMEMMRHFWDASAKVDSSAREMDAGQRFAICDPDNLRALFEAVGLQEVETTAIDIQTRFRDFDDYWLPFLGAQGSISKYFRGLSDETRTAIRDQLRQQLPITEDGEIPLVARAWAVKGTK